MTGRDLIIYILANNLEDIPVIAFMDTSDFPIGYVSKQAAALMLKVGTATIDTMYKEGQIKGIKFKGETYYEVPVVGNGDEKTS